MATTIPATQGAHVILREGDRLKISNLTGTQVVDIWAFPTSENVVSWMSMAQSRSKLQTLRPAVDATFIDTHRQAVLTMVQDTSPGIHDMLFPCCDDWRYKEVGSEGHRSCGENLRSELAAFIATNAAESPLRELEAAIRNWGWTPEPLNIFMNIPVASTEASEKGSFNVAKPSCKAGDFVVLRADVDCLLVMSACPNDLMSTNDGHPTDAAFEILASD